MPSEVSAWRQENAMSLLMQRCTAWRASDPDLVDDEGELLRLLDADEEARDALDVLRRMARAALLTSLREQALAHRLAQLQARRKRYQEREIALRDMVLMAMQALDLKRFDDAEFTAFRKRGSAKVIITDQAALPGEYIRETIIREPDKLALKEAMAVGEVIEGAVMSNPQDVLTIKQT